MKAWAFERLIDFQGHRQAINANYCRNKIPGMDELRRSLVFVVNEECRLRIRGLRRFMFRFSQKAGAAGHVTVLALDETETDVIRACPLRRSVF